MAGPRRFNNKDKRPKGNTQSLVAKRRRAALLLRCGGHLSPMLVDLVRGLVPADAELPRVKEQFDDLFPDDESPYYESPYAD